MLGRDAENGLIFGVCAGLAKYLNVDVRIVRVATVVAFFLTGTIIGWIYLLAAVILAKE